MKLIEATAIGLLLVWPAIGISGDQGGPAQAPPHTAPAGEAANKARVIFTQALKDVPGKQMVVLALELAPKGSRAPSPHRHSGSVYVYVTRGTARLGLDGEPVREVHAGESFYEPRGALHRVSESASATESASAIAVLIIPEGAPILTPEPNKQGPTQEEHAHP